MRYILSISILLFSFSVFGQQDSIYIQVLKSDYSLRLNNDSIFYTNKISSYHVEQNSKNIKNSPIIKFETDSVGNYIIDKRNHQFIPLDTLILTPKEKDTILTAFLIQENDSWLKTIMPNSKFISKDTISSIFSTSMKSWDYFYTHYGNGFHTFMKPVFLRNKTVCIYYSEYHCGFLCGHGSLKVLVKENDKWHLFSELGQWVS